jgi:PAS domain S-box-containing protein
MQPIRILLIEDNEDDALLVLRAVRAGGFEPETLRVETAEEMRAALSNETWDLVISDFSLPSFNGPAALQVLKQSRLDIPFLIVSGTVGEETAVAALKAGAHDFLSKNNLNRLIPAITRELREAADRRERRLAQARMRESEEAFAAVFRSSPLPIITVDVKCRLTALNRAAEQAFGLTADALGSPATFLVMPPDTDLWCERVYRGETIDRCDVSGMSENGNVRTMLLSASPLRGQQGEVTGAVAIISDVTDQRALELQLRQAQKMEAVGRLAGGIAHDFNNILTAIQGYATLLQADHPPGSVTRGDVDGILDAASRAATFTRQLLAFSRKQVTQPESLNINELVSGMLNMLSRVIGKEYPLEFKAGDVQPVFADRGQLGQVLMNLVVNARDAMPRGGTITLRTSRQMTKPERALPVDSSDQAGPYAVITISDEGHGIAAEDLDRLFEPFFTTKDAAHGTGLGLSTVYGIVTQHGGVMTVDTTLGKGTEFSVYLPERVADVSDIQPTPVQEARDPVATAGVLVVEDDRTIRVLRQRALVRKGFEVVTAASADEALQLLMDHPNVDVLITDLMLPGMTGMELIAHSRAAGIAMKTILISGYTAQDLALPSDIVFVEKPFTPDILLAAVHRVLTPGIDA